MLKEGRGLVLDIKFEMPIRYQNRALYLITEYVSLGFRKEVWATEKILENYWVSIIQLIMNFSVWIPCHGLHDWFS